MGYNHTKTEETFLKLERHWTTISDAVAALLLGVAKVVGSDDASYAILYLVAAIILLISSCIDIPATHIWAKDTSKKLRLVTIIFNWIFGLLALAALIFTILAVANHNDHDAEHTFLLVAYALGIAKYGGKIIQKTIKAIASGTH